MRGQRHLIKCRCVLQQFKSLKNPPPHHFLVFSVIGDDDKVLPKYSQCNNCGIIHKVTDICTSDIVSGKEAMNSIVNVEDIKVSLPANLVNILERHNVDITVWEQAQFILENKSWGDYVVLTHDDSDGEKHGKYLRLIGDTFFKVENFTRGEILTPDEMR